MGNYKSMFPTCLADSKQMQKECEGFKEIDNADDYEKPAMIFNFCFCAHRGKDKYCYNDDLEAN